MQPEQPAALNQPTRPAKRFTMPAVVFGLLGGHVLFVMIAITLATGDRSFAVVPEYYQKAVAFDDHKSALAESEALGWSAEIQPGSTVDALGGRAVVVVLQDRDGGPVEGAVIEVSGFHFARAGEPLSFGLTEVLPGQYAGSAKLGREGFWRFDLLATRGDERFVAEFKQFVHAAEPTR